MDRFLIRMVVVLFVFVICINGNSLADEGSFQTIPSNTTECSGNCMTEVYPYAVMSADVYEDEDNHAYEILPNWYYLFSDEFDFGFTASAYFNPVEKKIVYAFRGTDDPLDWTDNFLQYFGIIPLSYYQAAIMMWVYIDAFKQDNDAFTDWELIVTGHSLGGGLSQFVAKIFRLKAYTFNTAPLHDNVGDLAAVVSYLTPVIIDYQDIVGIGDTDILNIVSYNTEGSFFDFVSWSPGELYGTTKYLEIDETMGLLENHGIGTIVDQLEQYFDPDIPDTIIKFDGEIGCVGQSEAALFFENLAASITDNSNNIYKIDGEGNGSDYDGDIIDFKIYGEYDASMNEVSIYIEMYWENGEHVRTDYFEANWTDTGMYDDYGELTYDNGGAGCDVWLKMTFSD
jgi:hypothetical protein